ncbi:MAG: DUF937 domain-containing protein [Alsobacter sp.]
MLNLFEMIQQAQNGAAVDAMAKQFDLTPKQAENAVDVLLPAFALALQRQMQNPQLWPSFFAAMQPPSATPGLDAGRAMTAEGMRQGAEWMERLFGSSDLSRQVAAQAAAASGLPASMLQQMMPAMATMLMSGMLKTFSQQGLAGLVDAMGRAMQAGVAPPAPAPGPSAAANPFTAGLEAWSKILAAASPAPEPPPPPAPPPEPEPPPGEPEAAPNPFDPAGFATIMGRMFGLPEPSVAETAPQPQPEQPPPEPEAPAAQTPTEDQAEKAAEQAAQAWSSLVDTGREVQEQYLKSLQELFGQMLAPPDKTS